MMYHMYRSGSRWWQSCFIICWFNWWWTHFKTQFRQFLHHFSCHLQSSSPCSNYEERGQWVMAYVDSNHGASVNDVESLGWNLSLRRWSDRQEQRSITALYNRSMRSNSIFALQKVSAVGLLMVIAYKPLPPVYQVFWLRAMVKSCASP